MSAVDRIFFTLRSLGGILPSFFRHGWGPPPTNHHKWLQSVARRTNAVPAPLCLVFRTHTIVGREAEFLSPCRSFLPPESARGRVWLVEPAQHLLCTPPPVVVHLAGTGDHRWYMRYSLFARQLAKAGMLVALLENPSYGNRRPPGQYGAKLNTVHDLASMGRATAEECASLLAYFRSRGHERLCTFGVSQGGLHAAMAASLCPFPVNVVSALAPASAAPVFTRGCLSAAVAWSALSPQDETRGRKLLASHLNSIASIGLFPPPLVPHRHTLLAAVEDQYVHSDAVDEWRKHRPSINVRFIPGGHLTAVALRSTAIRDAVIQAVQGYSSAKAA